MWACVDRLGQSRKSLKRPDHYQEEKKRNMEAKSRRLTNFKNKMLCFVPCEISSSVQLKCEKIYYFTLSIYMQLYQITCKRPTSFFDEFTAKTTKYFISRVVNGAWILDDFKRVI